MTCQNCGHTGHYCPNCGQALVPAAPTFPTTGGWRPLGTMQSTAAWPAPAPAQGMAYSAWRRSPARTPDLNADVWVPVAQALATGLAVAGLAILPPLFSPAWPWFTPVIAFSVTAPIAWFVLLNSNRQHMWAEESFSQEPPEAPAPPAKKEEISLNVVHKSEGNRVARMFRFDLPPGISEELFLEFARGVVLEHRGLSEKAWSGPTHLFSRPKFGELMELLTRAGLVRWINDKAPSQGRELTGAGRRALMEYVYSSPRTHAHASSGGALVPVFAQVGEREINR